MKSSRKSSYFSSSSSSSSSTVTYTLRNDHTAPPSPSNPQIHQIPVQSLAVASAAARIQSAYRAHAIRKLFRTVSSVNSEASELQSVIQRQETVDAIRSSEREKVRVNEALMRLLLRLDSVPGVDPAVREARRKVSRRIVGLQEIVDAVCEAKVDYDIDGDGFLMNWDRTLEEMEKEVCRERGGEEMERFCAQYLGFRCLQRFLHEP